jgi:hypothetical protein
LLGAFLLVLERLLEELGHVIHQVSSHFLWESMVD